MPTLLRRPRPRTHPRPVPALGLAAALLVLTGCAGDPATTSAATSSPEPSTDATPRPSEAATVSPRLAITYDGGVLVLDATTLETVGDLELDGFTRLNGAGDGRHLLMSTTGGFRLLDAGTWAETHGDHAHYYTQAPSLPGVAFEAQKPGHVVVHDGRTVLFDDGTGEVHAFDSAAVAEDDHRQSREYRTPSAHHGVAIELADGTLVVSHGTEDARTGIRVLDSGDAEIAASDECPGVHGEAVAADDAVVIGCEDGALVWAGGAITKVASPDAYGRIGNQAGSDVSPVVLGDYKSDPDVELERPTRVSLIDARTGGLTLVDLPASYSFRSLGRGDAGEALVLGTDGALHVVDPETAALVRSVPVIDAWEEPLQWQAPRPTLFVLDGTAYVTDPSTDTLHAVDVETGEIWNSVQLPVTPNELDGVSGEAAAEHAHAHDETHDDETHDDGQAG
ncbi:zinc metallochaperone AztD [uncultured Cellulomonas sp.]|uniref:zinc metallochaperone AztD n=1 Tax=uncultured Cellulomonas sp. TaxID=189682 RepID=UPI0026301D34|nr:zinc metallochaperone AztD [uncultured Cellulomonas sp.]